MEVRLALSNEALKMYGIPSRPATSRSVAATSRQRSWLSMTHGPAISARLPSPMRADPAEKGTTSPSLMLSCGGALRGEGADALQVFGGVDADRVVLRADHEDPDAVLNRPQLLERFGDLQRRWSRRKATGA